MQVIGDQFSLDSKFSFVGRYDNFLLKSLPFQDFKVEKYLHVFLATTKYFADDIALGAACNKVTLPFLKEEAERRNLWYDYTDNSGARVYGMEKGFLQEIKKTTSVLTLTEDGWQVMDYMTAAIPDWIKEEWENILAFFIVFYRILPRQMLKNYMNALIEGKFSLTCLDWGSFQDWVLQHPPPLSP